MPCFVLQMSKSAVRDYYLDTVGIILPRSVHWSLQALLPFSITSRFLGVEPCRFPVVQDQSRGSCKVTHNTGVGSKRACYPPRFSFSRKESEFQGDLSLWCSLGRGRATHSLCSCDSYFSHVVSLDLSVQWMLQTHPNVLGFSQGCLVLE